ncbi:MAG: polyphenol oxidase family protein, partial [Pseudomonadota bacterium]|nr:polyphenol oxidase family protein [Pseudomonadota bacterium]
MLLRFTSFDDPSLVHAITTRTGGVSEPPYDALNMSFSRPDNPHAVRENRCRVCSALEIAPGRVVQAGQIHGNAVQTVSQQHAGCGALDHATLLPP